MRLGALLLLINLLALPVFSQGDRASYDRADQIGKRLSGKVFRDRISPQWIEGSNQFWYRIQLGKNRHRFILVDPDRKTRVDAFDHDRLAEQLAEVLENKIDPDQLPLKQLVYRDGNFLFLARGKPYRWTGDQLENFLPGDNQIESTVKVLDRVIVGKRKGAESTHVIFVNRTDQPVKLFWLNNRAAPKHYQDIAPGKSHRQHTYPGHTWMAKSSGRVVGVFEADPFSGVAVIDGNWKAAVQERKTPANESPDRKWSVSLREYNLYLKNQETGESTRLTHNGVEDDPYLNRFYWAPDSSRLVGIQEKKFEPRKISMIESAPEDTLQPKKITLNYNKPGDPLVHPRPRMFDIASMEEIPISTDLFDHPWSIKHYRWSPDSSSFSFIYNQRGHQIYRLLSIDADSGGVSTLIEEAPETFFCYSSKSFYRPVYQSNDIIWMSERDGWNHLYRFDQTTGRLKNQITRGQWVVRKVDRVDNDAQQIWFQAGGIHPDQDPYHLHFCRINFDGSGLTRLTEGDGNHAIEFSPSRDYFIDTYSRVDLPPVSELRRTSDGSLVTHLETADISELEKAGWQMPERFVAKGRDGKTDIYGVIFRPTQFDPDKNYPVIEQIYAGPHSSHVPKSFSPRAKAIAELGFVVVQIDGMGTSNRSKAFHDYCWQNIGDAGFPDRIAWIKAAAKVRPWMDLERIGIYGGSAGGQNAMRALIAHHDFYKVAVADCGCHDNRMDKIWWNEQWMGYPIGDQYARSSNVDQAHRMEGKLLLIVGEVDRNVDPASTMQVVDALVKADKDFDLLVMPGVGHGAAGHPYAKRRQRDFFVRHLLGVEPRSK